MTEGKEFDRTQWPELVACRVTPTNSQDVLEVEVSDAEGNTPAMEVPKAAVILTNMPQVLQAMREHSAPQEIVKTLEQDTGLGLLACRILERFDENDLVRLELPAADSENAQILVAAKNLARRK